MENNISWGLVPLSIHCDGAEFFRDSEFYVWSISSVLASGSVARHPNHLYTTWKVFIFNSAIAIQVVDIKFPSVVIPYECMSNKKVSRLQYLEHLKPEQDLARYSFLKQTFQSKSSLVLGQEKDSRTSSSTTVLVSGHLHARDISTSGLYKWRVCQKH